MSPKKAAAQSSAAKDPEGEQSTEEENADARTSNDKHIPGSSSKQKDRVNAKRNSLEAPLPSQRQRKKAKYKELDEDDIADDGSPTVKGKARRFVGDNDSFCKICNKDDDPETQLCCETCPNVCHMACLRPPLTKVPKGDWFCPDCENLLRLDDVEKILAEKQVLKDSNGEADKEGTSAAETVLKYHVKWKKRSYMHAEWISDADMQEAAKMMPSVKRLLQRWNRTKTAPRKDSAPQDLEEDETGEVKDGIAQQWLQVEKIIGMHSTKRAKSGYNKDYFVKWRGLPYEDCTWERQEDLKEFEAEIQHFEKLKPIVKEAQARKDAERKGESKSKRAQRRAAKRQEEEQEEVEGTADGSSKERARKFPASPSFLEGGSLHPYQLEGLNWLYFKWTRREHIILADEMGLGKTVQTIAFLAALYSIDFFTLPHLVVVPLSTMRNWQRELELWAPFLNVVVLQGTQQARDTIFEHEMFHGLEGNPRRNKPEKMQAAVKFHVLLTTYEMMLAETQSLSKLHWGALIVDEGHRLKNKHSRLFQVLQQMNSEQRVLLTGTPLQNNIAELFFLMHFLDPEKFGSLEEFEGQFSDIAQEEKISKLHALLSPHLLRRLKKDVLKQLPPKLEQIVRVDLSDVQRKWYRSLLTRSYPTLMGVGKDKSEVRSGMKNLMMELRKCCNHPYLFPGVDPGLHDPAAALEKLIACSGKLQLLDKMMPKLKEKGHRVLVYSQFTRVLDILEDWLVLRRWGYQRIDGTIAGAERQKRIDKFNKNPDNYFVFLLSTRAGGVGINLATADTVVIYDSDWNPHNDLQATARAHRLGQEKPVMTYRLISRNTIEERMMDKAKKKMVLEHVVVRKMQTMDLKQDELDDILRFGAQDLFAEEDAAPESEAKAVEEGTATADAAVTAGTVGTEGATSTEAATAAKKRSARIVYDDAAIDKLLDRTELLQQQTAAGAAEEPEDSDFMKGFKVANFNLVEEEGAEAEEEEDQSGEEGDGTAAAAAAAADPEGQQPGSRVADATYFWATLLKTHYEQFQAEEGIRIEEEKKRRRKAVKYTENVDDDEDEDSDYEASSEEADDQEDADQGENLEDGVEGGRARKRRKRGEGEKLQSDGVQHVAPPPPPLISHADSGELLVYGFNTVERVQFIEHFLRFGLLQNPPMHESFKLWSTFQPIFPNKSQQALDLYGKLLITHITHVPSDQLKFPDGISRSDTLGKYSQEEIAGRIGLLHILQQMAKQAEKDELMFMALLVRYATTLYVQTYRRWTPRLDLALMQGVMEHGFGQWLKLLQDSQKGLMRPVRKELGLSEEQILQLLGSGSKDLRTGDGEQKNSASEPGDKQGEQKQTGKQGNDDLAAPRPESVQGSDKGQSKADLVGKGAESSRAGTVQPSQNGQNQGQQHEEKGQGDVADANGVNEESWEGRQAADKSNPKDCRSNEGNGEVQDANRPDGGQAAPAHDSSTGAADKPSRDAGKPQSSAAANKPSDKQEAAGQSADIPGDGKDVVSQWLERRVQLLADVLHQHWQDAARRPEPPPVSQPTVTPFTTSSQYSRFPFSSGAKVAPQTAAQQQPSLPTRPASSKPTGPPVAASSGNATKPKPRAQPRKLPEVLIQQTPRRLTVEQRRNRAGVLQAYNTLVAMVNNIRNETARVSEQASRARSQGQTSEVQKAAEKFRQSLHDVHTHCSKMMVWLNPVIAAKRSVPMHPGPTAGKHSTVRTASTSQPAGTRPAPSMPQPQLHRSYGPGSNLGQGAGLTAYQTAPTNLTSGVTRTANGDVIDLSVD